MANMSTEKVKMPEQDPNVRNKNFSEVALGYEYEMAKVEAERCLQCKNKPCIAGCPVNVQIPEFIKLITEDKLDESYELLKETNSLPAICGRVCPQETQCEELCIRGKKGEPVAIGRLERYVADRAIARSEAEANKNAGETGAAANACGTVRPVAAGSEGFCGMGGSAAADAKKAAIIGSGPASLTCAGDLAKRGYDVTIFEAFHIPGGVLMYGIPEFRLPKKLVQQEIDQLKELGVKIELNAIV